MIKLKKIYLASPRGFCAGVRRAVDILGLVLKKHGPPVYVRHQIVHNRHVVSDFEKRGVIFVEDLKEIPNGAVVIFSAHGSPPDLYRQAKKKNLTLYDSVCPLVVKVHFEAKRYEKEGYYILYIGHKNHAEAIGVISEVAPKSISLISGLDEAEKINPPQKEKLVVLNQTTLSQDDTKEIINCLKKRFPRLVLPPSSDICFSSQNRQNAVKELAKKVDLILVVGSKNSSNSNRLKEVAEKAGIAVYLIDDLSKIKKIWLKNVEKIGITAGASVPENIVQDVIKHLSVRGTEMEEIEVIKESINFPLPKEIYEN
jgi:4-hydroxy-3-methylbut-2-enyl diphosphate reductase